MPHCIMQHHLTFHKRKPTSESVASAIPQPHAFITKQGGLAHFIPTAQNPSTLCIYETQNTRKPFYKHINIYISELVYFSAGGKRRIIDG